MKKFKYLLIDIGNSNTKIAKSDGKSVFNVSTIKTSSFAKEIPTLAIEQYQKVVVSSVVPDLDGLFLKKNNFIFVNHQNVPIIKLDLLRPDQLGADRIANALAAYSFYKTSCLIVGSGTATTLSYVDKNGVYQGGIIFPGLTLCSKALQLYTAKIPLIYVQPIEKLFGKDTYEDVEIGLYQGTIHLINGFIKAYKEFDPEIQVIGTGFGLTVLKDKLDLNAYDEHLLLKGLIIYANNL